MKNENMKTEQTKHSRQPGEPLINPKFYPLVWFVVVFCAFVRSFYQIYATYSQFTNIAMSIYYGLVELFVGGGSSAVLILLLSYILYNMGARRGLRAVPKKDFTYLVMIFVSIAWFVSGMINLFSFLDPAVFYCNIFTGDFVAMTVSMALMFFLVLVPNYLNPKQAELHFNFYGKIYVIFNSVVYILGAIGVLSCIAIANDPALLAEFGNVYYSIDGNDIPISELFATFEFAKKGMEISAYISIALAVLMIVAYFVLSYMLKNKAKDFNEDEIPHHTDGIYFTDGKNFYTVDDIKNGRFDGNTGGNPFGDGNPTSKGNENPFDDDDEGDDKIFEEFDI